MSTLMVVALCAVSLCCGFGAGLRVGTRRRRDSRRRGTGHRVSSDRRPVVR